MRKADTNTGICFCDISSGELNPGELLLSRARFRFSSKQISNQKTIFTNCRKSRPLSNGFEKTCSIGQEIATKNKK